MVNGPMVPTAVTVVPSGGSRRGAVPTNRVLHYRADANTIAREAMSRPSSRMSAPRWVNFGKWAPVIRWEHKATPKPPTEAPAQTAPSSSYKRRGTT
jgi:hypothetical protein